MPPQPDVETSARPPPLDLDPALRPGVPMKRAPQPAAGAHEVPGQQPQHTRVLHRAGLTSLPPVFGTAQPPKGASGLLRRVAYAVPETQAKHWMLLILADRVDVLEHSLRKPGTWALAALAVGAGLLASRHARVPALRPG
jgi:hypothetical protein